MTGFPKVLDSTLQLGGVENFAREKFTDFADFAVFACLARVENLHQRQRGKRAWHRLKACKASFPAVLELGLGVRVAEIFDGKDRSKNRAMKFSTFSLFFVFLATCLWGLGQDFLRKAASYIAVPAETCKMVVISNGF